MPEVRKYNRQSDSLKPLPDVRRSEYRVAQLQTPAPRPTPDATALGAGFGAAVAATFGQLYAHEQDKADKVRLLQADKDLGDLENSLMYDPKTGALSIQGEGSYGLPQTIGDKFKEGAGKIRDGLANDLQRLAFDEHSVNVGQRIQNRLSQHIDEQRKTVEAQALNGKIENETQAAIADGSLPRIGQALNSITLAYQDHAMNPDGSRRLPKDIQDAATAKAISRVHVGVLQRMINQGDDIKAKVYYDEFQGEIQGEERGPLEQKLNVSSTRGDAGRVANELWMKLGPATDEDPVQFDKLADAARAQFPNDPERSAATIDELKERKIEHDSARESRSAATESKVWKAALDNVPLAQIQASAEFKALPGAKQLEVSNHVMDRLNTLKDRARTDTEWLWRQDSQAFEVGQRARTLREQREQDQTKAAFGGYLQLSDPNTLVKYSEDQLRNMLPKLGDRLTQDLIERRRALQNQPDKLRNASIDEDMFKFLADQAGLKAYAKESERNDTDNARLGALKSTVLDRISTEERAKKRDLTRDEKKAIMQEEIDRKVSLNVWGTDPTLPAAAVTRAEASKAYVPVSQIPGPARSRLENMIRGNGTRITDDKLSRAYAAALRGDDAALQAILNEK